MPSAAPIFSQSQPAPTMPSELQPSPQRQPPIAPQQEPGNSSTCYRDNAGHRHTPDVEQVTYHSPSLQGNINLDRTLESDSLQMFEPPLMFSPSERLDAPELQQTVQAVQKRPRSRLRLSRLFTMRWRSESPSSSGMQPKKKEDLDLSPGMEWRRKLCFVGDGACGKTCLLM